MAIQRPKSPDEAYREMVANRQRQMANLKALEESLLNTKRADQEKAVLEADDRTIEDSVKKEVALNDLTEKNRKNVIKKAAMEAMSRLKSDGMRKVRDKVMFEIVYESLWVDDDVKREEIKTMFDCYKDTAAFLEQTCPMAFKVPKTKITAGFDAVIEETVNGACDRITKVFEAAIRDSNYTEELLDKLKFNLTTDEEAKMDEKLTDLGQSQIVNLVKKKVLNVVQDEKKRGEKRAELFDELDAATKDEEPQDDETMKDPSEEEPAGTDGEEAVTSDDVSGEEDTTPDESISEEGYLINRNNRVTPVTEGISKSTGNAQTLRNAVDRGFESGCREYIRIYRTRPPYSPVGEPRIKTVAVVAGCLSGIIKPSQDLKNKIQYTTIAEVSGNPCPELNDPIIKQSFDSYIERNKGRAEMESTIPVGESSLLDSDVRARIHTAFKKDFISGCKEYLNSVRGESGKDFLESIALTAAVVAGILIVTQLVVGVIMMILAPFISTFIGIGWLAAMASTDSALESMIIQNQIQEINRNGATSIFEGLNMFNRMATQIELQQTAEINGLAVEESTIPQMVSTAAMIQTLTQYTVMETLNTMKYCNLNSTDVNNVRMALNKASSRVMRNMDAAMENVNLTLCSQLK